MLYAVSPRELQRELFPEYRFFFYFFFYRKIQQRAALTTYVLAQLSVF